MSGLLLRQQKTRGSGKHARNSKLNGVTAGLVAPVLISFAAILLTTLALFMIQSYQSTEHLLLVYLLSTIFIAIYFGSTVAVLTSLASGLAAAYFLLPPQFSFYVADSLHIAELGFTTLLAVIRVRWLGSSTKMSELAATINRNEKATRAHRACVRSATERARRSDRANDRHRAGARQDRLGPEDNRKQDLTRTCALEHCSRCPDDNS